MKGHFVINSFFLGPTPVHRFGIIMVIDPIHFHEFPAFREGWVPIDVFLTIVSPPDKYGYCSLRVGGSFQTASGKLRLLSPKLTPICLERMEIL